MSNYIELAVPGVQQLHPYQPGKPVSELQRELGLESIIKLASNENPLGPSPAAAAVLAAGGLDLAEYPDGNGFALKARIAERHNVSADRITLGNGSNDILEFMARGFLSAGRAAVFSEHAFAVYPLATMGAGGTCKVASASDYAHDLDAMAALIDDTVRIVFVANPNNPTGHWIDADSLRRFLSKVPQDVLVVIDEAYSEYVDEPDYPDCTQWLDEFPNLVVTRTFSKIFGMAALRLGYGISHPQVADVLNRVRQPFNTNAVAQAAGLAALDDTDHIRNSQQTNAEGMAQWLSACKRLGLDTLPSVGNFIAINVARSGDAVFEAMLREGVIVRPVSSYGMPEFIRVTIGNAEQNQRAIDALTAVLPSIPAN